MQADKLSSIGLLAAGVAHEVNTPLAVISTYAQMLAKQISGDEQKAPLLEKIARQTFRASEIVNSLLNFSRTSTTEFGDVDLNKVIQRDADAAGAPVAEGRRRGRNWSSTTELPAVQGNPGKLQQVFLNLFLNARDAMEGGGTLAVRTWTRRRRRARWIVCRYRRRHRRRRICTRIFDPFFTTKGRRKGHRPGPFGQLRHRAGAWRRYRSQPTGASGGATLPVVEASPAP